ncbi:long-chain fatty acid outer membrane transporter [Desulfoluna limicola]|uniref:Long-chain fatty acid outer membrane transporter n=1 Tax=Desulfoluna limicola TaxID=2810562 RepID=A0ABM7PIJ8_9BACT|nr:outer membrane protein transport protein [Desulfoluna limicola]BCS96994.1 long-chain fatty acid outer membrane transporter [Desulfoluna limicola]
MGKRLWSVLGILLCVSLVPSAVYANIDNLSNMSAEWIRTGNRNAATDAADIVLYNPAGLTELSDGVHINISNQTLIRKPEHSFDVGTGPQHYEQDSPDYLLPNFYASWNKESWSLFGGIYIPGGGATVDYPEGSITTQLAGMAVLASPADPDLPPGFDTMDDVYNGFTNDSLEASSIYLTTTLGGAYKINEKISVAAGVRCIYAKNTVEAELTLNDLTDDAEVVNGLQPGSIPETTNLVIDSESDAGGFGGILGVNFNATDKLNLALNYQTRVKLDFETDVNRDDLGMFTEGEKNRRDFPAFLGLGAGYDISEKLYTEVNWSYWFQKDADWGEDGAGRDISDMAGDAWSAGATLAYKVTPTFQVSGGTTYTKFEWDDINGYYNANLGSIEVLYSDNWHVGVGCAWEFKENFKLNLSVAQTIWDDETIAQNVDPGTVDVETENETTVIAIGLDMAF